MKKIRINELARELEVKAHEILDRLPELGVAEKKTHSSSIDEGVAIKLRRLYGFDVPDLEPDTEPETAAEDRDEGFETVEESPSGSPAASTKTAATENVARTAVALARPPPMEEARPIPGFAAPFRPPLAGRPIHPPVLAHGAVAPEPQRPPPAPPPQAASPQAPAQTPPSAVIAPGRPAPPVAKPLPGPAPSG